ncbi:MAG: GNAT family N-acetyltransferase [Alphaproteobacteria bacterium]|nr:GNAT family N-acetyltransferase [Alphaproteobacteria bacterium]
MTRPGILPIKSGDHAVVAALQERCFADPWGIEGMARTLSMPGVLGLVIRVSTPQGRSPVGFAVARVVADEVELLTLGVLPAWRCQGLARRLVKEACMHAMALGARHILLEVAEDNAPARALYARYGFSVVGHRPGYYRRESPPAVDALIMRGELSFLQEKWR